MVFEGRILTVLPTQSGTSKEGKAWSKQEFIFEYFEHPTDRFSDKVVLSLMGDNIAKYALKEGEEVTIGFGHNIHEHQGRYFNDMRMYHFARKEEPAAVSQPTVVSEPPVQDANTAAAKADDLPF